MSRAKRWVFTLNNYTEDEEQTICDLATEGGPFSYLVFGREVGASGTPHLQGFFALHAQLRHANVRQLGGLGRAYLEVARGSPIQSSTYCKKDGDYYEFGELPGSNSSQGKRSDFERLRDWVKEQDTRPTIRDVWDAFPSIAGRYPRAVRECIELFSQRPSLVEGTMRPWQQDLLNLLEEDPDDRSIMFYVDPEGGKGKSWVTRYLLSTRDDVQYLSIGKRDDLAYAVDVTKKVFVFDIPRGSTEFLQYSVLEKLKDQMLFSPKYDSCVKILPDPVHVIVFTNEAVDETQMTGDRYNIVQL